MNRLRLILTIFILTILFNGCRERKIVVENRAVVSIAPLKPLVENILGDDFEISVLVPQGASPETFEPTPKQLRDVETARFVFGTGLLEFEQELLHRIARNEQIINLSQGVELITGTCSHAHHSHNATCEHDCTHEHHHAHGIDPHIWCSPKTLGKMAENTYSAIAQEMPDSTKYGERYTNLCIKLLELDEEVAELCRQSPRSTFFIYHPALTYYARAYSLEQIAIEDEGKEPSAKHIAHIIDETKEKGVTSLLYQSEYPRSVVDVVAKDMGIEPTEINPLAGNPLQFIRDVTRTITNKKE